MNEAQKFPSIETENVHPNLDYQVRTWGNENVLHIYPYTFNEARAEGEDYIGKGSVLGIVEKLDWINELGVTSIWLGPIYESPGLDGNYDISDYRQINKDLGTMEDVELLIKKAHDRNIRVIFDLVPNHTSDQHEWFKASSDPNHPEYNKYKDYYIWRDPKIGEMPELTVAEDRLEGLPDGYTVPNNWTSIFSTPQLEKIKEQYGGIVPEDVEVPAVTAWVWSKERQQFYLAEFMKQQPSLNWQNPEVSEEIKDVVRFWLDKGVDGFRVDVVNHLGKDPTDKNEVKAEVGNGIGQYNKNETNSHDRLKQERLVSYWPTLEPRVKELLSVVDEYPDRNVRFILEDWISALSGDDRMDNIMPEVATVFNFIQLLATNRQHWDAMEHRDLIERYAERMKKLAGGIPNQVTGNHDTDMVRTRLESKDAARTAQFVAGMLPGMWYVWQREMLGTPNIKMPKELMQDAEIGLRDGERVPITWDSTFGGGFSEAQANKVLDDLWLWKQGNNQNASNNLQETVRPDELSWLEYIPREVVLEVLNKHFWLPPVDPAVAAKDNIELQMKDPKSNYSLVKDIMHLRNNDPVFTETDNVRILHTDNSSVLAFARQDPTNPRRQLITVANFSAETTTVALLDAQMAQGKVILSSNNGQQDGRRVEDISSGRIKLLPDETILIESIN